MRLNYNKICYLVLHSIAIGLGIFLSCLLLFTDSTFLTYLSFFLTYGLGILLVKKIHQYPLFVPAKEKKPIRLYKLINPLVTGNQSLIKTK